MPGELLLRFWSLRTIRPSTPEPDNTGVGRHFFSMIMRSPPEIFLKEDFFMSVFFNWSDSDYAYNPTTAGYVLLVVITLAVFALILKVHKDNSGQMTAKELTFCAAAMALAYITSFIKFASLPFGGSVTLFSMFFICLIGYVYGIRVGITAGVAFGMLQMAFGGYIYHPVQALFDYPLAFGVLGLAGVFANKQKGLIPGYILGAVSRYVMHVISGYVFFKSYAPENMNPMVYTLTYNMTYILPEMIATVAVLSVPAVASGIRRIRISAETPVMEQKKAV